ncbi:unnamed protein product [Arabidopsis halleri]
MSYSFSSYSHITLGCKQVSEQEGACIRVISRRKSSRNQQHFDLYFNASRNADNTSSPRLTTDVSDM